MVAREGDDQLWGSGRGAIDVVPLLGAIVGCHCSVLWLGEGDDQLLGEWTWCHCWVPLQGAIVVCDGKGDGQLWGVDVVPLLGVGAIAECQSLFHIFFLYLGPPISPRHP